MNYNIYICMLTIVNFTDVLLEMEVYELQVLYRISQNYDDNETKYYLTKV